MQAFFRRFSCGKKPWARPRASARGRTGDVGRHGAKPSTGRRDHEREKLADVEARQPEQQRPLHTGCGRCGRPPRPQAGVRSIP